MSVWRSKSAARWLGRVVRARVCAWWAVGSAFIAIGGRCEVSHLGRTALNSVQQLVFQLHASGQPVLVGGQPVVIQLRNCSTLTAANGDELVHTTIGDVMPAGPAQVAFSGSMTFVGGTGDSPRRRVRRRSAGRRVWRRIRGRFRSRGPSCIEQPMIAPQSRGGFCCAARASLTWSGAAPCQCCH